MTTINDILKFTETFAPLDTAADFDNCGLLVGDPEKTINRVLVTLDITKDVVAEAEDIGAELIISHHPVIFNPLRTLKADSVPYLLAKSGISALCLHTNLDIARDCGVNLCLAQALSLDDIKLYPEDFLCIGKLPQAMYAQDFAFYVKNALKCKTVAYTESNRKITTVAMCSGAGGDFYHTAIAKGADAFLTGEAKHHEYLEAVNSDISMVTAGHYDTEAVVVKPLAEKLSGRFSNVRFIPSRSHGSPVNYV